MDVSHTTFKSYTTLAPNPIFTSCLCTIILNHFTYKSYIILSFLFPKYKIKKPCHDSIEDAHLKTFNVHFSLWNSI